MDVIDRQPAEEEMLRALLSLPAGKRIALRRRIRALSLRRGLTYERRPGEAEPLNLVPLPALMRAGTAAAVARICARIMAAVKRIAPLALSMPSLREVLPLLPREEAWMRDCWRPSHAARQPIIHRLDADLPLGEAGAAARARFFESNSVAVGGMVYGPVASAILEETTLRAVRRGRALPPIAPCDDTRLVVARKIEAHAGALGGRRLTVAVLEDRGWDTGITEMPSLVSFLRRRGIAALLADPRELALRRDEIVCRGRVVDVVYRNAELRDLVAIEEAGEGLAAVREAFRRNRVISSLCGEFDHKSLWEVFTSERFRPLLTAAEAALFRRHIPWTRLVAARFTTDGRGRRIDLPSFISSNRERLVLKPNRHCGGVGVAIGMETAPGAWDRALGRALREGGGWVAQERIDNAVKRLPWAGPGGLYRPLDLYTTWGFISTPQGFGAVGRACRRRVVNVAAGGALLPVFLIREGRARGARRRAAR
ncbi:MAG: hypothetical protein PHN82_02965 [bacterium]|nr:hypothetical protein [bacterium]